MKPVPGAKKVGDRCSNCLIWMQAVTWSWATDKDKWECFLATGEDRGWYQRDVITKIKATFNIHVPVNKYHPPPVNSTFESPTKYCRKKNEVLTVVTEMVDLKKYRVRRWLFILPILLQRACLRCPIKFEAKKQPQGWTAGGMGEQINTEWETNPGLNLLASNHNRCRHQETRPRDKNPGRAHSTPPP